MNNKTKQNLAILERRVIALENVLYNVLSVLQQPQQQPMVCGMCGAYDPVHEGYVCGVVDCCMGMNPSDDDNS